MLLEKAKRGDVESFEKIILEYEKLYFNIAYRMLRDTEDAKDVTQTALFKIYKNIGKCLSYSSFKTWSCKIVTNTAIDFLRNKNRKPVESLDKKIEFEDGEINKEIQSAEPTPEEVLINKEKSKIIMDSIYKLDLKYRTVIILRDLNGFSYEEISRITGQPIGTVKSRISRARSSLKKSLKPKASEHKNIKNV